MKLLCSLALGLGLIWLALSQISRQDFAAAATPVDLPGASSNLPQPLVLTSFTQTAKLIASDRITHDVFDRVAIDGDTVVVGANNKAYVFVKPSNGWSGLLTETAKLIPSVVTTQYLNYGFSVAISGDTVVVGAASENNRGSAYIYVKPAGGWSGTLTETAKLTASDEMDLSYFGYSVAVSGDTVVAGAPGHNSTRGAAYIFVKPAGGWVTTSTFAAKLTTSDGADNDGFADKVTLNGSAIAASAPGDDSKRGSVYVFNQPALGWVTTSTFAAKLTASDGAANDDLGYSLGFSNNTIVAGAVHHVNYNGFAYVFVKPIAGWVTTSTFSAKLIASDRATDDKFGISTGIANDVVVIGAWSDDIGPNTNQGSVYVFVKPNGGWSGLMTETTKLTALDGVANDAFGISVAVQGNLLAVGAQGDDSGRGSAYLFISDILNPLPELPAYLPVILR
ncbi:MAG: FG-GAP repeat protein [Anaerolineales bacterium]|nr:FG-GAP repeat protein [Anaerolineales bacterium]